MHQSRAFLSVARNIMLYHKTRKRDANLVKKCHLSHVCFSHLSVNQLPKYSQPDYHVSQCLYLLLFLWRRRRRSACCTCLCLGDSRVVEHKWTNFLDIENTAIKEREECGKRQMEGANYCYEIEMTSNYLLAASNLWWKHICQLPTPPPLLLLLLPI